MLVLNQVRMVYEQVRFIFILFSCLLLNAKCILSLFRRKVESNNKDAKDMHMVPVSI